MNLNLQNKKGMTLIEIIIVVWIVLGLLAWLATSLGWVASKQKDSGRVKLLQEYLTYYDGIKQSLGQYPGPGVKGAGAAKDKAKTLGTTPVGSYGYKATFTFINDFEADGKYKSGTGDLPILQETLVEAWVLPDYRSIKQGFDDESIIIFTSKSGKRAVGCIKMYGPTEAAQNDGDWIPDTEPADSPNASNNGNRIYVYGDMWLWKQLGAEWVSACQSLVDPATL